MNHKHTISILLSFILGISMPITSISAAEIRDTEPDNAEQITKTTDVIEESNNTISEKNFSDNQPVSEPEEEPGYVIYDGKKYATGLIIDEDEPQESHISIRDRIPADNSENQSENLPSKFIPTDLPPLRNQNPYGTCWAFASTAVAEMNLIRKGIDTNPDLSELHLVYFAKNHVTDPLGGTREDQIELDPGKALSGGGNDEQAANAYACWKGVATESTAPYENASVMKEKGLDDSIAYNSVAHLQNYYHFPMRENVGDGEYEVIQSSIQKTKEFVYSQGAALLGIYVKNGIAPDTDDSVYSSTYNSYYDPTGLSGAGHAVTIVGWDDTFSKDNFAGTKKPKGDGAWLIRNSWTTGSFEDNQDFSGYFWLSYYSNNFKGDIYIFDFESADNYENNYQYDGGDMMGGSYWLGGEHEGKSANIFTTHAPNAEYGEYLKAVSFYCPVANIDYKVEVFTDLDDMNNPESGDLDAVVTGSFGCGGYYTIPLSDPLYLSNGETYSVVVTAYGKEEYANPTIGSEWSRDSAVGARKGQSFSFNYVNHKWIDYGYRYKSNIKIKAFTDNADFTPSNTPTDIVLTNIDSDTLTLNLFDEYRIAANVLPKTAINRKLVWSNSDNTIAKIDNGLITANDVGEAIITVKTEDGRIEKSFKVQIVNEATIEIDNNTEWWFCIGDQIELTATLSPSSAQKEKIVWSSSDPKIVSVDESGVITGIGIGQATITANYFGKTASVIVNSQRENIDFRGIADENSLITLNWHTVSQVTKYVVRREKENPELEKEPYEVIAEITAEPEKKTYSIKDNTFIGTNENKTVNYFIDYYFGDSDPWCSYTQVYVGPGYRITYDFGDLEVDNNVNPTYYRAGETLWLRDFEKNGYICAGCYEDQEYTNPCWEITGRSGDITVYVQMEPYFYHIEYNANGGYGWDPGWSTVRYNEEFRLTKNVYKDDNMPFAGWNTKPDGTGDFYEDEAIVKNLSTKNADHVVLYAQWDRSRHFIEIVEDPRPIKRLVENDEPQELITPGSAIGGVFKYKLGENGDYKTTIPVAAEAGTYTVYFKVFADEGYVDSEERSVNVTIAGKQGSITIPSYTVSFYNDSELIHKEQVLSGETVVSLPVAEKEGQIFSGWYRKDTGKLWSISTPVIEDLKIVAKFKSEDEGKKSPLDPIAVPDENNMIYAIKGQQISLDQSKTWNTENSKIVSVSKKGVIKAGNPGKTRIYCSNDSESDSFTVYVANPSISNNIYLIPGAQAYMYINNMWVDGMDLSDKFDVYFFSSNTDVVKIDSDEIHGVGKGTATVTAYINGQSYNCKVKVDDSNTMSGYNSHFSLMPLQSVSLKRSGFSFKTAVWESELQMAPVNQKGKIAYYQDSIVQINTSGKLTAIGTGHETITGIDSKGNSITLEVIVNPPTPKIIHLNTGTNKTVKFNYLKKTNGIIPCWSGSNEGTGRANVLSYGKITGLSVGRTTATCTFNPYNTDGFEYETIIYVENPAPETDGRLIAGKGTLKYTINMPVGSTYVINHPNVYQPVLYKSNKNNIAFVNEAGVIEARSKGKATLTTKINGKKVTINVTVQ